MTARLIGVAVTTLAVAAMAVDHLMGDDPAILEDPVAFLLSSALCIALALFLFGRFVQRVQTDFDAATRAIVLSTLAVVAIPLTFWLGLPFVLAGGGIALGLRGLGSRRRRLALAAVVLGALVVALGAVGYGVQFVEKLP